MWVHCCCHFCVDELDGRGAFFFFISPAAVSVSLCAWRKMADKIELSVESLFPV